MPGSVTGAGYLAFRGRHPVQARHGGRDPPPTLGGRGHRHRRRQRSRRTRCRSGLRHRDDAVVQRRLGGALLPAASGLGLGADRFGRARRTDTCGPCSAAARMDRPWPVLMYSVSFLFHRHLTHPARLGRTERGQRGAGRTPRRRARRPGRGQRTDHPRMRTRRAAGRWRRRRSAGERAAMRPAGLRRRAGDIADPRVATLKHGAGNGARRPAAADSDPAADDSAGLRLHPPTRHRAGVPRRHLGSRRAESLTSHARALFRQPRPEILAIRWRRSTTRRSCSRNRRTSPPATAACLQIVHQQCQRTNGIVESVLGLAGANAPPRAVSTWSRSAGASPPSSAKPCSRAPATCPRPAPTCPPAGCSTRATCQVLTVLVQNALRHGRPPGQTAIDHRARPHREGAKPVVDVTDRGPGIRKAPPRSCSGRSSPPPSTAPARPVHRPRALRAPMACLGSSRPAAASSTASAAASPFPPAGQPAAPSRWAGVASARPSV